LLRIDSIDPDLDLVADVEHVADAIYVALAHLGDVYQRVGLQAKVDESAVKLEPFYATLHAHLAPQVMDAGWLYQLRLLCRRPRGCLHGLFGHYQTLHNNLFPTQRQSPSIAAPGRKHHDPDRLDTSQRA